VLAAAALWPRPAAALDPRKAVSQYGRDLWGIEQGLPSATVRAIAQTRDGYLWLGTLDGLVRFDGVRFTVFDRRNTPELADAFITALHEDRDGVLWIGTDGGGVVSCRAGAFTAHGTSDERRLKVVALAEAPDGMWMAAQSDELFRLRRGALARVPGLPTLKGVSALHVDASGALWVGTRTQGALSIRAGAVARRTAAEPWSSPDVRVLVGGRGGATWVGTALGVARIAGDGTVTAHPVAGSVRALHEDRQGSLWIGLNEGGLARLRDGRLEILSDAQEQASISVRSLHEDREGSLWFGVSDRGLGRLRDGAFATIGEPEGLSSDIVIGLHAEGDEVWAGTKGGGLSAIRGGRGVPVEAPLSGSSVVSIASGAAGSLWAGTLGGGLNHIERGRVRVFRAGDGLGHDDVFALLRSREGGLWIGLRGGGLVRRSGTTFERFGRERGLGSTFVWDLLEDPSGTLFVATAKGVFALAGGAVRVVIPDVPAHALLLDAEGALWAGTARRGLCRLKDGAVTVYTTADGLLDDNVTQVLEDDRGNLWLGGSRGISRVSKQELEEHAAGRRSGVGIVAYDGADGLRSRECNYGRGVRTRDGRLWFPTIRGVAVVDPRSIAPNPVVPPVHVERVVADGRALDRPADGPAFVRPGHGRVEFHFTALSLLAPHKVRFAYRLEGFDDGWSAPSTERTATYTNLPPGRYAFRVRASNNDGLWNAEGDTFALVLRPHYYQTWWFYGLCAAAVAGAAWRVHLSRVQRLVEMERVRTRIAADLHDDIGSGLSQIAVLSEVVRQQARASGGPDSSALARISGTAGELVDSMSDIVWAVNPARDRMQDLTQRMRGFASEVAEARGLDLRFRADALDLEGRLDPDVRRQVYLIFKEAVNNAARHSGGTVLDVSVEAAAGRLQLRVRDDGCGFADASGGEGNGLGTIARRAAELGGRIEIASAPGAGTMVALDTPLARRRGAPTPD
jgi:ligand-binding sensor domain-containing protein/signal transduction histidine kinase